MKKLQNIYKSKYIIIGAGIGGLSLALALQKLNKKVLIFEKAPEVKEVGAGVMLTPNATRSLDYLGVLKEIEKDATLPKRTVVRHYKTGQEMSTTDLGNGFTKRYGHPYYDVHRVNIHSSLYNSVKRNDPDCIKVNHELIDFDQSENVVTAKFKISSDGSGSNINITGFPFTSDSGFEQQGLARETQTSGKIYFIRISGGNTVGTIIRYDASISITSNDTFEGQITYITNT